MPLSTPETEPLSIGHEEFAESAVDVKVGLDDVDHSVQDPVQKDQSSLELRRGILENIDEIEPQAQGVVSGCITNSTNGATSQVLSQNVNDHEQATNEFKSSTRTNEDIWNVVNELKSSVDQILSGIFTLTHHVKPGHPVS